MWVFWGIFLSLNGTDVDVETHVNPTRPRRHKRGDTVVSRDVVVVPPSPVERRRATADLLPGVDSSGVSIPSGWMEA